MFKNAYKHLVMLKEMEKIAGSAPWSELDFFPVLYHTLPPSFMLIHPVVFCVILLTNRLIFW